MLSVLWLFWCGLAWASLPHDSCAPRLDYTALVNHWGHVLDGYGYGYDFLGLRTNITRGLGLTNSSVTVRYDSIGQLTSWQAREGLTNVIRLNEQNGWAYDAAGNLRYRTNGGLVQTFSCDVLNQLTNVSRNSTMTVSGATPAPAASVTVNGVTAQTYGDFTFARTNVGLSDGNNTVTIVAQNAYGLRATNIQICNLPSSVPLAWDSNGNLTNDGSLSLAYGPENQLTNIAVAGAWKSDFVFDGLGRRRIERDYGWQGGQWAKTNELRFIYDGWLLVQVRDGNNNVLVTYTRGLDLSGSLAGAGGIGGLLARTDGSGSTFYHAGGAGNITGLMDGQQNMVARYMYGAFGRLTDKWGPMADVNVMQFSSMPVHRLSGFVHFRGREYGSDWQGWLQRDPIGEAGGINPYRFVYNNPLKWVDPWGFQGVQLELDLEREFEGEITREIREGLARSRIPSVLERIGESAAFNAKGTEMRQQGLDPSLTYLEAAKQPTKPPTADEIVDYIRKHPVTLGPCPTVVRYTGSKEAEIARQTGLIPNVDRLGRAKLVFVTPDVLELDASRIEATYQVGSLNPEGASEAPTHAILGNASGIPFVGGGNVAGVTGTELMTHNQIPAVVVIPLRTGK